LIIPLGIHLAKLKVENDSFRFLPLGPSRRLLMLGWMILFALLLILSSVLMLVGDTGEVSGRMASSVFAFLLLLAVLTRAARGRAW
jgi:hypothetical protein